MRTPRGSNGGWAILGADARFEWSQDIARVHNGFAPGLRARHDINDISRLPTEDREDYQHGIDAGTNRGTAADSIAEPKASLIFTPVDTTEIYLSRGRGFHSNDLRGVTRARSANAAEFWYVDRLPGEPAEGVPDVHIHPLEPRALRATVAKMFD